MKEKIYLALLHSIWFTHTQLHFIFADENTLFWEKYHNNYEKFYNDISSSLLARYRISWNKADFILENYKKISYSQIQGDLEKRNTSIVTFYDEKFPEEFLNISHVPFLIYVRWTLSTRPRISIVWARKMTEYGKQSIQKFTPELWKYFDVVSGWAAGCDTCAHRVSLEYNIPTFSIIGTGMNQDYPTGNKKLYDNIVEKNGAIISIFPLDEPGNPYNFPVRNELVAAYSNWLLVVEAKEKSGSLITTQLALDLWKDVFAIPGDISKITSRGCNTIIQSSMAKLVLSAQDILEEYNISTSKDKSWDIKNLVFDSPLESSIYNLLLTQLYSGDELSIILDTDIKNILLTLSMMELKGYIIKIGASKYQVV